MDRKLKMLTFALILGFGCLLAPEASAQFDDAYPWSDVAAWCTAQHPGMNLSLCVGVTGSGWTWDGEVPDGGATTCQACKDEAELAFDLCVDFERLQHGITCPVPTGNSHFLHCQNCTISYAFELGICRQFFCDGGPPG